MPVVDNNIETVAEERIEIAGPQGRLEGLLAYPPNGDPGFGVVIAGPHPFLGGDMQNNLVRYLLTDVAARGGLALAFNYAGVGGSEGGPADWPAAMSAFWSNGRIDDERDWLDDARSACAALFELTGGPHVVVGYSFGCWIASRLATDPGISELVLISPNPKRHAFDSLEDSNMPALVICSDNDFTCDTKEAARWYETVREPKTFVPIHAGEHFFRGREPAVSDAVTAFLRKTNVIR